MYLSRLELRGFKSFAEETTLTFNPGVTTIVGPNGCGKSNIVDAIRWVIGEQRPTVLRSKTMENLIFNGTANRRPLGMAEVELTIENTDGMLPTEYSEVRIGRRLFRDGTSKYLMNGTQCRLKDITDLFMDTGMAADAYSVIELKMIDELVSGSTEDRRRMFEEAAGITRYKMRRRQALRKLDSTQSDLERIRDLTDEVSSQVNRLERQAEKAQEYRAAQDSLERLELLLSQVECNQLVDRQAALQEKRDGHAERAEALAEDATEAEERLESLRETLAEQEETLQERREARQDHRTRLRDLEAEQRLQDERLERARRDRADAETAQDDDRARREELTTEVDWLESTLEDARPALDEAERALEEARAERDEAKRAADEQRDRVRCLREKAEAAADQQAERRRKLDRLTNRRDLLEDEQERTGALLDDVEQKVETLREQIGGTQDELGSAENTLDAAREVRDATRAERDEKKDILQEAQDRFRELERRRDAAEAEVELLDGLVSSYDELSDAVQFLATQGPLGEIQTVADVLACDDDVRVPLDAALGDLASCVVVRTANEAQRAVARLREADEGQASFVVLDRLPESPSTEPAPGDATPLRDHVRVPEPVYSPLADVLLHNCYVTDTLDGAEAAARRTDARIRVFSRTGEWVDARGVIRGGSRTDSVSPAASRLGRHEQLERARAELEECRTACDEQAAAVEEAEAALEDVDVASTEAEVDEAKTTRDEVEQRLERLRYELESVEERRDELRSRLDDIETECAEIETEVKTVQSEVEEGTDTVEALRTKRSEAEEDLEAAEDRERTVAEAFSEAQVEAVEARNRVENLEQELERTREQIEELDRRTARRAEKIQDLQDAIEETTEKRRQLAAEIDDLRATEESYDQSVEEAETAVQETKDDVETVERQLRRLRQKREEVLDEKNDAAVQLAETETRLQDLRETVKDDFDRNLEAEPVEVPGDFDAEAARDKVRSLRGTLNALGDVNPLALEEYEEEKERLDFLREQKDDLEEAEETLMETISEINATASQRFMETFEEINDSFGTLFTELFGQGASAELQLEDPDDPIDSAIEIIAKPRGKRPVTLDQLSSGEKALTATALLFAIYLVKPSPFCVLDEVDAPLDDANVERFMSLVRRFEDDTQFILVTHNQRTMELSDRMYGVTMEEQGVSTLVGVEFDEAMAMAE